MGTSEQRAYGCRSITGESVIIRHATQNDLAQAQALLGAEYDLAGVDYRECVVAEEQDPVAGRRRIVGVGVLRPAGEGRLSHFDIFTEPGQGFIAEHIARRQMEH